MPELRSYAHVIRPIPGRSPITLVDTIYPGKVLEFTNKTFVNLTVISQLDYWTGISHQLDLRIDGRFDKWDPTDWATAIGERLKSSSKSVFLKIGNPRTEVTVSLALNELSETWLYKRMNGVARANRAADIHAIRAAIVAGIAAVPTSGRTDCMRQSALCPDDVIAIRCKQRDVTAHQLPFLKSLQEKFIA